MDSLERLVASGASVREIARELGVSPSVARRELAIRGLKTARARRTDEFRMAAEAGSAPDPDLVSEAWADGLLPPQAGRLQMRAMQLSRRRTTSPKVKQTLVSEAGGACVRCGYSRCSAALQFHHVEPDAKSFGLGWRGVTRSIEVARAEAAKCVLLCANCHAEVEAGLAGIPDVR